MTVSGRFGFLAGPVLALCLASPALADCVDMDTYVYPAGEEAFGQRVAEALTLALNPPPRGWKTYSTTVRYPTVEACSNTETPRTIRRARAESSIFINVARIGTSPEAQFRIILQGNRLTPDTTGKFVETTQLGTPSPNGPAGRLYNVTLRIAPMPGGNNANATGPISPGDLAALRGMVDQSVLQSLMAGGVPSLEDAKSRKAARLAEIERASNANVSAFGRGSAGSGSAGSGSASNGSAQSQPAPRPSTNPAGEILKRLPGRIFR